MLYQLVLTAAVLGSFMVGWYALQRWVRRSSPDVPDDGDILEGKWGCRGCIFTRLCDRDPSCRSSEPTLSAR